MRYFVENPFNLNRLNILNITSPRKYQRLQFSNFLFLAIFQLKKLYVFFKSFDI